MAFEVIEREGGTVDGIIAGEMAAANMAHWRNGPVGLDDMVHGLKYDTDFRIRMGPIRFGPGAMMGENGEEITTLPYVTPERDIFARVDSSLPPNVVIGIPSRGIPSKVVIENDRVVR